MISGAEPIAADDLPWAGRRPVHRSHFLVPAGIVVAKVDCVGNGPINVLGSAVWPPTPSTNPLLSQDPNFNERASVGFCAFGSDLAEEPVALGEEWVT